MTIQLDLSDNGRVPQAVSPVPQDLCVYPGIILREYNNSTSPILLPLLDNCTMVLKLALLVLFKSEQPRTNL